jgi:hypothetical protein
VLFRDEYPAEYGYFKSALEREIQLTEAADAQEELAKLLEQLENVTAVYRCDCGEPGCATFRFDGGDIVGYLRSIPLEETRDTVLVDIDVNGNLLGLERAPDRRPIQQKS